MKSAVASTDLAALPALKVLARARAEGRMPHAILLTGADAGLLERAAEHLAAVHLEDPAPIAHPDYRNLRPGGLSRRIKIKSAQEVVHAFTLSSATGRRVVVIHEPDRFMPEAANCLLKSLEEPPPGTLIVLQTTNYYSVITTILSRCLRFHLGGEAPVIADPAWSDWLREFERLLVRMVKGPASPNARVSEVFIPLYALCARFEVLLNLFIEEALKVAPPPPPTDDDEDEIEKAHEATIRRGIRARMLISLEEKLRLVGRAHPDCGTQVAEAVSLLESARHQMDLNYQALAALEQFMLRTLRLFALRVRPAPPAGA
jgi:hypothetical protein